MGDEVGEAFEPLATRVGVEPPLELLVNPPPSTPVVIADSLVPVALPTVGTGAPERLTLPVLLGCENDAAPLEFELDPLAEDEVVDQEPAIVERAKPTAGEPLYEYENIE